jgi:hypothetical protein
MTQRSVYVLVPGTGQRWFCGGLLTMMRLVDVLCAVRVAHIVTYRDREPGRPFISDSLDTNATFVVAWGPHVGELIEHLSGRNVVYWANSFGWRVRPPATIPILSASRFTMGLWGEDAPSSPLYYLPNPLGDEFFASGDPRDIDVIHVGRKSSAYVREGLLPALSTRVNVHNVQTRVDDLAGLFRRSKVYLYDSRDYWYSRGVSEGFGLQPLEALACGCSVFSSVNAGLSDFLDPGFTGEKIGCISLEHDVERILRRVQAPLPVDSERLSEYRPAAIWSRWLALEPFLESDFAAARAQSSTSAIAYDVSRWRHYAVRPPRPPAPSPSGVRKLSVMVRQGLRRIIPQP